MSSPSSGGGNSSFEEQSLELALSLMRSLVPPGNSGNLVFSPWSLTVALMMTLFGTDGQSALQLIKVFFGSARGSSAMSQFTAMHTQLSSIDQTQLSMSHFLYPDVSFPLKPQYERRLVKVFGAVTKALDFYSQNDAATKTINTDVNRATRGLIPQLLDQNLEPDTVLVLLNTIYFKGQWKERFEAKNTETDAIFTKSGGQEVSTTMMHQPRVKLPYFATPSGLKAVSLAYTQSNTSLILILPPPDTPMNTFLTTQLTTKLLASILLKLASPKTSLVRLSLPRFKLSSTLDRPLMDGLRSLGITDIFEQSKADFNRMTEQPGGVFVSEIIQKATIEVNEEGTVAAAATAVKMVARSSPIIHHFTANRPFIYSLVYLPEKGPKQILFLGVLQDPSQAQ